MYNKSPYFYGTGRRKSSVARVRVYKGTGKVTINDRDINDYFGLDTSACSFNYITKWAEGDPKIVIDLGSKIQKCARQFIRDIEKFEMQELQVAA